MFLYSLIINIITKQHMAKIIIDTAFRFSNDNCVYHCCNNFYAAGKDFPISRCLNKSDTILQVWIAATVWRQIIMRVAWRI